MSELAKREEFRAQWLAALRSGEYKQAYGTYYEESTGCMCTLGLGAYLLTDGEKNHSTVLNHGLPRLSVMFPEINYSRDDGESLWSDITTKNDGGDWTPNPEKALNFEQMADYLDEVLPKDSPK